MALSNSSCEVRIDKMPLCARLHLCARILDIHASDWSIEALSLIFRIYAGKTARLVYLFICSKNAIFRIIDTPTK